MEAEEFNRLLRKIHERDISAFNEIYNTYSQKIKWVAFYMLGNLQNAEEVSSNVLLNIWHKEHKDVKNPDSWIYEITKNMAYDYYRKNIKFTPHAIPLEKIANDINVSISEDKTYGYIDLQSVLFELGETDKEIVLKIAVFSHTLQEVATELKMSVSAVRRHYMKALKKTKEKLLEKQKK